MINSGGSGTVPAGLPQGETEGFYYQNNIEFKNFRLRSKLRFTIKNSISTYNM